MVALEIDTPRAPRTASLRKRRREPRLFFAAAHLQNVIDLRPPLSINWMKVVSSLMKVVRTNHHAPQRTSLVDLTVRTICLAACCLLLAAGCWLLF